MATVSLTLRAGKPNKDGTKQVQLMVRINGKQAAYGTKVRLKPEHFDINKGKVKPIAGNSIYLNNTLTELTNEIESLFIQFERENKPLTIASFNEAWLGAKKLSGFTFAEWYTMETNRRTGKLGIDSKTISGYKAMFDHFHAFAPNILLTEINSDTLEEFEHYLQKQIVNAKSKKTMMQSTVAKQLIRLRIFVLRAFKKGQIREYPFVDFKIEGGSKTLKYLNEGNLKKLFEYKTSLTGEQVALDRFKFVCYTGLRFGNLVNLRLDEIATDFSHIQTTTLKGGKRYGKSVFIPLLPQAVDILKTYIAGRKLTSTETVFPKISVDKYNKHLHEIERKAKITQTLTSHIARHTFGTMANQSGLDDRTIADLLGQTDLRSTRIYSQVTERKLTEEMKKLKY